MEKEIEVYVYTEMQRQQLSNIFVEFFTTKWYMADNIQVKEYENLSYISCPFCTLFISGEHESELQNLSVLFGLKFNFYIYVSLFDDQENLLYNQLEGEMSRGQMGNVMIHIKGEYKTFVNL